MKKECGCSALFNDADWGEKIEVDRKKALKSSNIRYFKLTVHYFFEKVINKN
jgi:hypothetical protein